MPTNLDRARFSLVYAAHLIHRGRQQRGCPVHRGWLDGQHHGCQRCGRGQPVRLPRYRWCRQCTIEETERRSAQLDRLNQQWAVWLREYTYYVVGDYTLKVHNSHLATTFAREWVEAKMDYLRNLPPDELDDFMREAQAEREARAHA